VALVEHAVLRVRPATRADVPQVESLIARSARALSDGYYTSEQVESLLRFVFGTDTQLIDDGTYFVAERDGHLVGAGGWSRRRTLFGGDQLKGSEDPVLDPHSEPARTTVRVDGGPDVADQYIAEHAEPGDLVVTQDIPLAALLVPKKVVVLDPRGEEHTAETIGERLSIRDFMDGLRMAGGVTGGPPPYDARAKQAFAAALDRALTRLIRAG